MNSKKPRVVVEELSKTYEQGQVKALCNVSFTVLDGEFISVMGPSGSGKTTLLHMLGALDRPTSGRVLLDGVNLAKEPRLDRVRAERVGFVFQLHNLLPDLTALENVEVPLFALRVRRDERVRRAKELLGLVGLGDRVDHVPGKLSGGQRQRVALARALANEPALILADEPTGDLDQKSGTQVMELLQSLRRSRGLTLVMVTHDPNVARLGDRTLTLVDGKLQQTRESGAPALKVTAGNGSASNSSYTPALDRGSGGILPDYGRFRHRQQGGSGMLRVLGTVFWIVVAVTHAASGPGRPGQQRGLDPAFTSTTWTFDVETSGQDVSWNSPTSVDPAAAEFNTGYVLTLIEVDVEWNRIDFSGIDVTDEVPPELQMDSAAIPGPAPITLFDAPIVFPEPPEPPAIAADLVVGLDAAGAGFVDAINVTLGTLDVDLGIFGVQTVTVTSVRIVGDVTVHPTWFDLGAALAGSNGLPLLTGTGTLAGGQPMTLALTNARPATATFLVLGFSTLNLPFKGGTMVPSFDILIAGLPTDLSGSLILTTTWAEGVAADTDVFFQTWLADPLGVAGFAASNAVRGNTP